MDPDSETVRKAARSAFDKRLPGVPVADLVFDSLIDEQPDRTPFDLSDARVRHLRFETGGTLVDVAVALSGDRAHLSVRLHPELAAVIEVRGLARSQIHRTDEKGCADFTAPLGLTSLLVAPADRPDAPRLQTAWVTL